MTLTWRHWPRPSPAASAARSAWRLDCSLKKLVGDVLDRVDQFDDFDPRRDYQLTVDVAGLTDVERNAAAGLTPDDIELPPAGD